MRDPSARPFLLGVPPRRPAGRSEPVVLIVGGYPCTRERLRDWARHDLPPARIVVAPGAADLPRRAARRGVVALVDIDLPGKAGLELLHQVRHRLPTAALVALSAYYADAYQDYAIGAGAVACVAPQVIDGQLRALVTALMSAGAGP